MQLEENLDADSSNMLDEDAEHVIFARKRNEAYDLEFNLKLKQIATAFTVFAILVCCMLWCEPCLLGVIGFSACYCLREPILVVIFFVSIGMFLASHMPSPKAIWAVTGTIYELQKA
jgi:hypothetical protein